MTWRDNHDILNVWLAKPRVGLITDMDGTISHIVDNPDAAHVTPKNLDLLNQLQQHLTLVAVVSGRAVQDVAGKVGLSNLTYIGNHGMEYWKNEQVVVAPEIAAYRPNIKSAIADLQAHLIDGMLLEDKQTTLSIHYRRADDPTEIAQTFKPIVETIAEQNNLMSFAGRMIFEIRPNVAINKGTAFKHLVTTHNLDAALYIGDDTTDVDAFIMARHLRDTDQCYSFAVGVESDDMPPPVADNADMTVAGISDVEAFLSWLLSAISASST